MWRGPPRSTLLPAPTLFRAKYRLWKDLDEHWADLAQSPLVAHLVHEPTEAFEDPAPDTADGIDLDELAARCPVPDRKSTRLNSSHANISYAVFCLKKTKV